MVGKARPTGLTPQQFRENARQNLADARALLEQSPRNAAYLAGYSVEFLLKARYCVLRKWPRFPRDNNELVEWNKRDGVETKDKLFVHDLDALLRLSDTVYIKRSSFNRIDWDRATDWSEQIRYQPKESVSRAEAEELINEVAKVCEEFLLHDVLQAMLEVEIDISKRFGPFNCFSLVKHPKNGTWVLLIAWYARTEEKWKARECELKRRIDETIDPDLRAQIASIEAIDPRHPVLLGLYQLLGMLGGGILHSPRSMFSRNIVIGFPTFPDGFVITAGNWADSSLQAEWDAAPDAKGGEPDTGDRDSKV